MSGYIDAGYAVVLGSLTLYGSTLLARERSVRRRCEVAAGSDDHDPERTREPASREES